MCNQGCGVGWAGLGCGVGWAGEGMGGRVRQGGEERGRTHTHRDTHTALKSRFVGEPAKTALYLPCCVLPKGEQIMRMAPDAAGLPRCDDSSTLSTPRARRTTTVVAILAQVWLKGPRVDQTGVCVALVVGGVCRPRPPARRRPQRLPARAPGAAPPLSRPASLFAAL